MPEENASYTMGVMSDEGWNQMESRILIALTKHTDKKMDEYFKVEKKKNDAFKKEQLKHMRVVEGYLKILNKIVRAK